MLSILIAVTIFVGSTFCSGQPSGGLCYDGRLVHKTGDDCSNNARCCPGGQSCYRKNQWYSGCKKSCSSDWVDPFDGLKWSCEKLGTSIYEDKSKIDWRFGCEFTSEVIAFYNHPKDGSLCGPLCEKNTRCTHFSWLGKTGIRPGVCLLHGPLSASFSDAKSVGNDSVCGVKRGAATPWKPFIRSSTIRLPRVSSGRSKLHGLGLPITTMLCYDSYCKYMTPTVALLNSQSIMNSPQRWTNWFGQRVSSGSCPKGMLAVQFEARGVDSTGRPGSVREIRLNCATPKKGFRVVGTKEASWAFSEENPNSKSCMPGSYLSGLKCDGERCDNLLLECTKMETYLRQDHLENDADKKLAMKYAPQLRFDQKAEQFPVLAPEFWKVSRTVNGERVRNTERKTQSFNRNDIGIHYEVNRCSYGRVVITYWMFYEWQPKCDCCSGDHWGDWEHIAVYLKPNNVDIHGVVFAQHSGWYQRQPGNMEFVGTHPVVYVGKNSHGSYHDDGGSGSCLYFEDFRNGGISSGKYINTWSQGKLIEWHQFNEPWYNFRGNWGRDGVRSPRNKFFDFCDRSPCEGSNPFGTNGCSKNKGATLMRLDNGTQLLEMDKEKEGSTSSSFSTQNYILFGSGSAVLFGLCALLAQKRRQNKIKSEVSSANSTTCEINENLRKKEEIKIPEL